MRSPRFTFRCVLWLMPVLFLGCGKEVFTGKREARGVWMSRFEYANEQARNDPQVAKDAIRRVFRRARTARLNMVFFQVRGNGDAFYRSAYEPWSEMLTGTLGKDPGWDPLGFALEEAHALGLELHAWVNTFTIWRGSAPPRETTPRAVILEHPEWLVCDSSGSPLRPEPPHNQYLWISPGIPAARLHVVNVVADIVEKYDVDGIHFDYIRYPEGASVRGYSRDSISAARFGSREGNPFQLAWDHWQREQINEFVFEAYNAITARKPWVKVSAAVIGKYAGEGWTAYHAVYQDPRRWMEMEKIDFIVPMVYWERSHPTHPFAPLIAQWHDRVAYDRHVLPGIATSLVPKFGWREVAAEIREIRSRGLPGVVFFSASGLEHAWETLGVDEFPYWSVVPQMPWKGSAQPPAPRNFSATQTPAGVELRWEAPPVSEPLSTIVYRSRSNEIARDVVTNILYVTGRSITSYVDGGAGRTQWFYAAAAIDRLGNESELSQIVQALPVAIAEHSATPGVSPRR